MKNARRTTQRSKSRWLSAFYEYASPARALNLTHLVFFTAPHILNFMAILTVVQMSAHEADIRTNLGSLSGGRGAGQE